jgi:hypothetical protein
LTQSPIQFDHLSQHGKKKDQYGIEELEEDIRVMEMIQGVQLEQDHVGDILAKELHSRIAQEMKKLLRHVKTKDVAKLLYEYQEKYGREDH